MNEKLNQTWFSPDVISLTDKLEDGLKTSDRYKEKLILSDSHGIHLQFIQQRWLPKATQTDPLIYIDAKYQYRPDIISVDYYNTPLFAWAILAANDLRSVWEVEAGMYLKIPDIAAVVRGLN